MRWKRSDQLRSSVVVFLPIDLVDLCTGKSVPSLVKADSGERIRVLLNRRNRRFEIW